MTSPMEARFDNISEIRYRTTSTQELTDFPKTTEFLSRTRQTSLAARQTKVDACIRFGSSNSLAKEQKIFSKLLANCEEDQAEFSEDQEIQSIGTEEEIKKKIINERNSKVG